MLSVWINRASFGLIVIAAILLTFSIFAYMRSPEQPEVAPCNITKPLSEYALPGYFLPLKEQDYAAIGAPLFQSHWNPISLQLPDLRNVLSYYGINSRPDAKQGAIRLQFGVGPVGGAASTPNTLASTAPQEPLYLVYERNQNAGRYLFSPNNQKTSLWVIAEPLENSAKINVFLQDESGNRVQEPAIRAQFSLQQKELPRTGTNNWSLGPFRVDGTLLARLKARWFGQDLFINDHGGPEYADRIGKERIEFGEGSDRYIVYLGQDSCLVWKDQRFVPTSTVKDSSMYPLLCVKKIEERLLRFELWDVEGKVRVPLTMLRSTDNWNPTQLQKDFAFLSARTLSQYIFSIRKERTTLRTHDWFLLTKEGWKRLATPAQIDAYVEEKEPGALFVFEGPKEKGEVRVLSGMLYNTTRSTKTEVEYPIDHGTKSGGKTDTERKGRTPSQNPSLKNASPNTSNDSTQPAQPFNQTPIRELNAGGRYLDEDDDDEGEIFNDADGVWIERETQLRNTSEKMLRSTQR